MVFSGCFKVISAGNKVDIEYIKFIIARIIILLKEKLRFWGKNQYKIISMMDVIILIDVPIFKIIWRVFAYSETI